MYQRKVVLYWTEYGLWPPTYIIIPFRFGRFIVTVQTFIKPLKIYQQAPACSYYKSYRARTPKQCPDLDWFSFKHNPGNLHWFWWNYFLIGLRVSKKHEMKTRNTVWSRDNQSHTGLLHLKINKNLGFR